MPFAELAEAFRTSMRDLAPHLAVCTALLAQCWALRDALPSSVRGARGRRAAVLCEVRFGTPVLFGVGLIHRSTQNHA